MEQKIRHFNRLCQQEGKGFIFVYHPSKYSQNYHFDCFPNIVLSIEEFIVCQEKYGFELTCKVIPLLLAKGSIYNKVKNSTSLYVCEPLVNDEFDIKRLIALCRKDNKKNIWLMHPRTNSLFIEQFKQYVHKEDQVITFNDELLEEKDYHIVPLLMSQGEHYHQFINKIPSDISMSRILPLQPAIKAWFESKKE